MQLHIAQLWNALTAREMRETGEMGCNLFRITQRTSSAIWDHAISTKTYDTCIYDMMEYSSSSEEQVRNVLINLINEDLQKQTFMI